MNKLLLSGGTKCRTIDKVDIFGDSSGVALYQLDGNANDTGGNHHGTETAIAYGGGTYGRGAVCNGTTSVIASTALPSMGTSNAVSFYINTASTANQGFIEYSNGTNLIAIYHTSTTLAIRVNALLYTVTTTLPKSVFNHLVVSFATNVPTLYLNGALQTLGSVGATAITGTTGLRIGVANIATVHTYTNGSMDQVRIFNRAITATEVATLYAECAPTSIVDNANPFEDNSLKAMYQFNGNADDLTGVYNGTATDVTYSAGKFGECAVFNGSSSYISGAPIIQRNLNPSFSFWVKPTVLNTTKIIFNTRTNLLSNGYSIYLSTSNQIGFTHYTVADYLTASVSAINTTSFCHIVVSCRTGFVDVYVNGALFQKLTTGTYVAATAPFANIGVDAFSGGINWFNGSIEQFRIFNKALTPMEVAALYTETTPMEEPLAYQVDPFKDGSGKALYRLEGNALDESGNYNGTATSVTYGNGISGRCGVFNGSNSYISSTTATLGVSSFSYSLWVNPSTISTAAKHMIDFVTNRCALTNGNGTTSVVSYYDGAYKSFAYTLTASVNTHLVLVVSTTSATLYANGVSQGTIAVTSLSPSGGVRLGSNSTNNGAWYAGNEDQVRFFNRALTQDEVTQLYNAGA